MSMEISATIAPAIATRKLTADDLRAALAAGWRDFCACPVIGLLFGSIYVLGGLFLTYELLGQGQAMWLIAAIAGFPLLAPMTAVGLYEVSRRREAGLPVTWRAILSALQGRDDQQVLVMCGILFVGFSLWMGMAHGISAIFLSDVAVGSESAALFGSTTGLALLMVGGSVGALIALGFFSITVISLPLLVDRDVDFITAMIASVSSVRGNKPVMLGWAALVAASLFVAMLPLFLGLLVVLPVLGHATWHLYRRTVVGSGHAV